MSRAYQQGFTLIEMLVTVAVSSILIGIAVPSLREITIKNRLSTYTNELIGSIAAARSEAVRRGSPVSICASSDGENCGDSWNRGWIVFSDANGNLAVDDDDDDSVLKVFDALASNYAIGTDAALADGFTYGADGATNNTGLLSVCYGDDLTKSRAIVLTRLRPRVAKDTDGDQIPEGDDAANISRCDAPGGG